MTKNHARIINVKRTVNGVFNGWLVTRYGPEQAERIVTTVRTTNKRTGEPLKKPVEEQTRVPYTKTGIQLVTVKRRKTLRKMGVRSIPR